jgi:pilus assembly protein Flp/PilA
MPRLIFALIKRDRRAVTALEYGLIAALIAVAIIAAVSTLGTNLSGVFDAIGGHFSGGNVTP